jgi:hypothetical protein
MEETLKTLGLGLLIRSVFAGAFFPISYYIASHPPPPYRYFGYDQKGILATGLAVSLLAGITVYGLHRSLLYPLVEWLLDWKKCADFRNRRFKCRLPFLRRFDECHWCRLISDETIKRIRRDWGKAERTPGLPHAQEKFTAWGDFAHLQYCSAICLLLGILFARWVAEYHRVAFWPLIFPGFLIFLIAGFVTDWRLRTAREKLAEDSPEASNQHDII